MNYTSNESSGKSIYLELLSLSNFCDFLKIKKLYFRLQEIKFKPMKDNLMNQSIYFTHEYKIIRRSLILVYLSKLP